MKRFFIILLLLLLLFTVTASSHPGRTDSNGGHWDRKEGTYHYHSGEHAGESSLSSFSETADNIEAEENTVETDTLEEEIIEKEIIENQEEKSAEEENTEQQKTLLLIVLSVIGVISLALIIFISKNYDIENAGCLIYLLAFIIFVIFYLSSCSVSGSEKPETYESHIENCNGNCAHVKNFLEEEIRTGELHDDYCNGQCDHVEDEIFDRVYEGELIRSDEALDEEDLNDSYWQGAYYGYIQGYGDCYYGNDKQLELDEYVDEELF